MIPTHILSRICRRHLLLRRFNHAKTTATGDEKQERDFKTLFEKHKDKITFNSYLEQDKLELGYFRYYVKNVKKAKEKQEEEYRQKSRPPLPVALKYFVKEEQLLKEDENVTVEEPEKAFQLPFSNTAKIDKVIAKESNAIDDSKEKTDVDKWMTNYEYFDDSQLEEDTVDSQWSHNYGTPDPTARVSMTQCGGCGALLHCSDPAIPGYLPSEIFKQRNDTELKTLECQRCHFLKEYNIALDVTVQPEEYEKLLESIRHRKSLVVLMVDLLDFPCSIWPGIVDIIGTDRPIIIVGNKVDLIPADSVGYLQRIKDSLMQEIGKTKLGEANIKYVSLISAKSGYGVEDLISAMFKVWLYKGDVFLVGCTNVGKSSLFNALLQSDYCKVHAVDIIKRATVSRWPGTTLNLLKFPINRPSGWKMYERANRLRSQSKLMKIEKEIRKAQLEGQTIREMPSLIGHIGRTFSDPMDYEDGIEDNIADKKRRMMVLDEKDKLFVNSKWFYDTPGVVHPDQALSLLTTEELLATIPKRLIRPQTYYLHKGSTIFVAGLARLDLTDCENPCRLTIFCSDQLPITVTKTEDADEVYNTFLGTELLAVPSGGTERLKNWPNMKKKVLEFTGEGPKICCGDIVLSSIAWVSVTAKKGDICVTTAWTPEGKGIFRRYPSLLPYSINLKGKRVRDTPAYMTGKIFNDNDNVQS
ncbi:nitric oxide-associated protein 1-like isoform X1 [Cydia fagiglandana]|uniref:nitric oxide-associated protein 1-like isoform X1 n=1 Tax=Cydia fagiglandana TaxID=1458189 RepID=UPI002FEE0967